MTTLAEFQTYYTREKWREGDTAWDADFPFLVKKAEARINRDLKTQRIVIQEFGSSTDPYQIDLPNKIAEIVSFKINAGNRIYTPRALAPSDYSRLYVQQSGALPEFYSVISSDTGGARILYSATTKNTVNQVADPVPSMDYELIYVPEIASYLDDPANPFYDRFPDFYEAALDVQAYKYLKDYEASADANAQYLLLLDSMRADSEHYMYPSGQIDAAPAGNVM